MWLSSGCSGSAAVAAGDELDVGVAHQQVAVLASEAVAQQLLEALVRIGNAEGDVVDVVVHAAVLDESPPQALLDLEQRRAVLAQVDLGARRQLRQRVVEVADAQRDVGERARRAVALGAEQRDLAPAGVRTDEREGVGAFDHVHPDVARQVVAHAVAVDNPERNVVESLDLHRALVYPGLGQEEPC